MMRCAYRASIAPLLAWGSLCLAISPANGLTINRYFFDFEPPPASVAGGGNIEDIFNAAADLWGGRVVMKKEELTPKLPTAPIEFTKNLSCPLLGLFGNEDAAPTPDQVNQHEAELKKHGKAYEFHRYDGAGHGFFYYDRPNYRVEQALDGWKKVWAFFGKHLGK